MREVNINGLDLNLMPALDALLRRRNVTHAAAEVGLSQPAMSRALARLRALHGDPLLVRTGSGYALTPRAEAIRPGLAEALNGFRELFQPPAFDPAEERRTLRVAAADAQTVLNVPAVMARLAEEAPGVDLRIESYGSGMFARMENGDLDFAFALANTPLPPGAVSTSLVKDNLALVMRQSHPAATRPWTIEDYGAYPHVGVALVGDGQSEIDADLAAHGVVRRIVLTTPHFMAALAAVAATDAVTTLSSALARRFARTFDLVLKPPPLGDARLSMTLVCSHIRAADPLMVWFRGLVREVAEAALAAQDAPAQF